MKNKNNNKYEYKFVNGDTYVINIGIDLLNSAEWIDILRELDRLEYNNNQTESRRHCSLDGYDKDAQIKSDDIDVLEQIILKEKWEKILSHMTQQERLIFQLHYDKGFTQEETAKILELSQGMISFAIKMMRKKIKKFEKL